MIADHKIAESRWQNRREITDGNIADDKMGDSRGLDGKVTTDWKGKVLTRWQKGGRLSKMTSSRLKD